MKPIASLAILSLLAASACVPRPQPTPPEPASAPSPTATASITRPPIVYQNWLDAPQTVGDWTYARNGSESSAAFGPPGSPPRFSMTCDLVSKRITLAHLRVIAAEGATMTIRTESMERDLPTNTGDRTELRTWSYLNATDPLLDAMALTKGRFAVEVGAAKLYLPSWAEVSRVIEDCR